MWLTLILYEKSSLRTNPHTCSVTRILLLKCFLLVFLFNHSITDHTIHCRQLEPNWVWSGHRWWVSSDSTSSCCNDSVTGFALDPLPLPFAILSRHSSFDSLTSLGLVAPRTHQHFDSFKALSCFASGHLLSRCAAQRPNKHGLTELLGERQWRGGGHPRGRSLAFRLSLAAAQLSPEQAMTANGIVWSLGCKRGGLKSWLVSPKRSVCL